MMVSNQIMPMQVAQQGMGNNFPHPNESSLIGKYGNGMFNCDCMLCLYGTFCYPCAVGQVAAFSVMPGHSDSGTCCMYCLGVMCCAQCLGLVGTACVGCNARSTLEDKMSSRHPGMAMKNQTMDCMCHCCCPCFAVAQEHAAMRAFHNRGIGSPSEITMER